MAAKSKKSVPATPKFNIGRRVKWADKITPPVTGEPGRTYYCKVISVSESQSANGFVYQCEREDGCGTLGLFESQIEAADVAPAAMLTYLIDRYNRHVTETVAGHAGVVTEAAQKFAAVAAACPGNGGEWMEQSCSDVMLAAAFLCEAEAYLLTLSGDGRSVMLGGDRVIAREEFAGFIRKEKVERLTIDLLHNDGYRHNSTREADGLHNRAKFRAKQKAWQALLTSLWMLDQIAECEGWLAAGLPECPESEHKQPLGYWGL
jgi:hypothetical protein